MRSPSGPSYPVHTSTVRSQIRCRLLTGFLTEVVVSQFPLYADLIVADLRGIHSRQLERQQVRMFTYSLLTDQVHLAKKYFLSKCLKTNKPKVNGSLVWCSFSPSHLSFSP